MPMIEPVAAPIGPAVPHDPELAAALPEIMAFAPGFASFAAIPEARARLAARHVGTGPEAFTRQGRFVVSEQVVPGPPDAPEITLLVIRPTDAPGPGPAFYHIHGGGMMIGTRYTFDDELLDWAEALGAAVISVEYRLAPETPHPGPVEDCYAGLAWLAANARELDIDPGRIVIVGTSAGGGLAAGTALLARDRGGPALAAQVLLCPMLDDRDNTVSAHQEVDRGVWNRQANRTGWTALLGEARGGAQVPIYAAPARATDLAGLPPTYIDVGSADTLRDEAVAYASAIWRAGGIAELCVFSGGFHGYATMAPAATVSRDTRAARLAWLRRLLPAG